MKKRSIISYLIIATMLCAMLACLSVSMSSCSSPSAVLNVYNWGQYISDGSEESFDVNAAFEEWYEETYGVKVEVNYSTYASNEDMYAKLKSGGVSYDIIIPSDYMIERLIKEDMLIKFDAESIPNYKYIDKKYKNIEKYKELIVKYPISVSLNPIDVENKIKEFDKVRSFIDNFYIQCII